MPDPTKSFEQIAEGVLESQAATQADSTADTATTATAEASATVDTSAEVDESSAASLRDRLAALNFQVGEQDDDLALQERLIEAFSQQTERNREIEQQLEYFRLMQAFGQPQVPATPPATTQTAETPTNRWWNPPVVDENLVRQYASPGPDGQLQWKPNTPPQVQAAYEARVAYKADFAERFLSDPAAALAPLLEEKQASVQRMVEDALWNMQETQARRSAVDEFVKSNESWLYSLDPVTQKPRMLNGQPMLSAEGNKFNDIYAGLLDRGLDEATALSAAHGLYIQHHGNKEETRNQIANNRLQHVLNGSAGAASRNGHQAAVAAGTLTGQAAKTNESFETLFWRNFTANGGGE